MKGVRREGHKGRPAFFAGASSCLSSCHPYSRTAVPPGCICPLLSPWLLTLLSLVGGLLREPQAPAAVTRYLCIGSYASPFRGFPLCPLEAY